MTRNTRRLRHSAVRPATLRLTRRGTLTLTAALAACMTLTGPVAPALSTLDGQHSCYTEVAEDGSADHYCQSGTSDPVRDASWPADTFSADGDWHSCPDGAAGNADPVCSARRP